MSDPANTDTLLADLRARGWNVAVHSDYKQDGEVMSYWLLVHPDGMWVEGSGANIEVLKTIFKKVSAQQPKTLGDEILELGRSPRAEESSLPETPDPLDRVVGQKPRDLMEALEACGQTAAHVTDVETILAALPRTWTMLDRWNKRHGLKVVRFDADLLRAAYQDQLDAVKKAKGESLSSSLSPADVETPNFDEAVVWLANSFAPEPLPLKIDTELPRLRAAVIEDVRLALSKKSRQANPLEASDLFLLSEKEIDDLVKNTGTLRAGTLHELAKAAARKQLDKIRKGGWERG